MAEDVPHTRCMGASMNDNVCLLHLWYSILAICNMARIRTFLEYHVVAMLGLALGIPVGGGTLPWLNLGTVCLSSVLVGWVFVVLG